MSNIHSLYGSMFGIKNSNGVPYLKDVATGVQVASDMIGCSNLETFTSTTDTLNKYGVNIIASTGTAIYALPTPNGSGRVIRVVANGVSTSQTINMSSANGAIQSTAGSSMFNILFTAKGAAVDLQDISTVWLVINHHGSSAAVISS